MTKAQMADQFIHDQALCETDDIGARTQIGAFAHVSPGTRVGADCKIGQGAFLEDGVAIGDRVTIESGVRVCGEVDVSDDVYIGSNTVFTRERHSMRSQPSKDISTVVNTEAAIGANATILSGIDIGRGAKVDAGAVVTRSVPANAIVTGNPAHIVGYTETPHAEAPDRHPTPLHAGAVQLEVGGAYLHRFAEFSDLRGSLTAGEIPKEDLPFVPRRWFLVYDVPNREVRGEHAHRRCHQFLICVSGGMTVAVDDGERRAEVTLDSPALGLYIPPLVWASQFRYSADAVLLVLASDPYDASDYIRDYELFLTTSSNVRGS